MKNKIIYELEKEIMDLLDLNHQGLGNAQISKILKLNVKIPKQRDYISWTILQHLLIKNMIIKEGTLYMIK